MTSDEARKILALYRPHVDANDPTFAEALAQVERDPELARYLEERCATDEALRQKLRGAPVPGDLLEKTLRYRPAVRRTPAWLQLAACILMLASIAYFWLGRGAKPARFENYRRTMASVVTRYKMSLETDSLDRVRTFLANNQAPADYVLPARIAGNRLLGCATLSWDGNPVSLLCFRHQNGSDLWLFIMRKSQLVGEPSSSEPMFGSETQVHTASWREDGNLYLLATRGDPQLLRESLP